MKILIIGSIKQSLPEKERREIQDACLAIGRNLAAHGIDLVVGSDSENTVDRWVVDGAAESSKRVNVYIYKPEQPDKINCNEGNKSKYIAFFKEKNLAKYSKLKFQYMLNRGPWRSTHVAGMQYADVVLVISGAEGARTAGHTALVLQKPMLPLACFNGSGKTLWQEYSAAYHSVGFSGDEDTHLFREWTENSVQFLLPAIKKLIRNNPYRQRDLSIVWISALSLFSMMLWIGLFYLGSTYAQGRGTIVIVLGLCSAIFGLSLRNSLEHLSEDYKKKSNRVFVAEIIAGTILTFAFYIFFVLGSVVISSSIPDLDHDQDFKRIGLCVSIIGIAASFLLEKAVPQLT